MALYRAPLTEISFLLKDVMACKPLSALAAYHDADVDALLERVRDAARLMETELAPLRRGSDAGCGLADGSVQTPAGYREFYRRYVGAGWAALSHRREHGGGGAPFLLGRIVEEMMCSANVAFAFYPAFTNSCYEIIASCADHRLKQLYLPRLASGEWTGTRCFTEPHAGSDLGAIKTRAVANADGSYRIEGGKIFISGGDHDLSDNIVYLVLARLPHSPPGVKGLSTFLVPKLLVHADGSLGAANAVRCVALEHKMGLQGSATCAMAFEGATGWLVGRADEGLQNMLVGMNRERIGAGIQGVGLCELATQAAVRYARERRQGAAGNGRHEIIAHPDVRRMLMKMKAITEGARLLAYDTALQVDFGRHHPDPEVREAAQDWVELTTPVVKAFCTDAAFELGALAIQVHGGHGYIREQGIEQIARDAKILALYEGANGIQAMDLVRRKLLIRGGRLPQRFFAAAERTLAEATTDDTVVAVPFSEALAALRQATAKLQHAGVQSDAAAFGGDDYLRAFALTLLGWNWLRMQRAVAGRHDGFAKAKRVTAEYFATRLLTQVPSLCRNALRGAEPMLSLDAEYF